MLISGLTLPWRSKRVSLSSLICTLKGNMTSHYSDNHNSMERNCRIRSGLLQCAGAVLGRGIFASRATGKYIRSLQSWAWLMSNVLFSHHLPCSLSICLPTPNRVFAFNSFGRISHYMILTIEPSHSRRCYSTELADCYQQRIFLYQLGHHCLHQLALPLCAQGPKRYTIQRDIWVEVNILVLDSSLAHVGFPHVAGLLS